MNIVFRSDWFRQRGWEVWFFCCENSKIHEEVKTREIQLHNVDRNPKYFAIRSGYKLYSALRRKGSKFLFISDNRDMSVAVWARFFSRGKIKVIYSQAMQLGVKKRDFIHTKRFNNLDAWIAPLPYLMKQAKEFTNLSSEKLFCIRLGTETSRFQHLPDQLTCRRELNLPEKGLLIGVLGRFDPQKGQLEMIQALNLLKDKSIHLLLMGEKTKDEADEYFSNMLSYIHKNGMSSQVFIRPFNPRVEFFFTAIDIFVLPSHSETYGMVTVEAMINGKQIIATDAGGTPELLEKGKWGTLFQPGNADDLALKLQKLIGKTNQGMVNHDLVVYANRQYSHIKECELLEDVLQQIA